MATPGRDGGGVPLGVTGDSPSSTSDLAGHDASQQPGTVCRWRTRRHYDQECSRFFDCPSHIVERALSDGEQDGEEDYEDQHQEQDDEDSEDDEGLPDPGAVSPLSESGNEDDDESRQEARSPSPGLPRLRDEESEEQRQNSGLRTGNLTRASDSSSGSERQGAERSSGAPLYPVLSPTLGGSGSAAGSQATGPPVPDTPVTLTSRPAHSVTERSGGSGAQPSGWPPEPSYPAPSPMPSGSGTAPGPQTAPVTVRTPTTSVPRPTLTGTGPPSRPEVVVPRWQPDSEVTYCPICHAQFNIFVRKHHCRKCGRVVCNACSPHRITIPHQYIVRPPGAPPITAPRSPVSPLDSPGWYPGFSGGEKVRLCNPCVPDPNTAPPQQRGVARQPSDLGQPADNPGANRWGFYFGGGPSTTTSQVRNRSVTMPQQPGTLPPARPTRLPFPSDAERQLLSGLHAGSRISGTSSVFYTPPPMRSQADRPLYPTMHQPYRSMLDIGSDRPGPSTFASSSFSEIQPYATHRFTQPPPPPQIPEEDECPVCHRELPRRSLPNFEALREAHIDTCITANSSYRGRGASTAAADGNGGEGSSGEAPLPPIPTRRRTGMFPYTATEKDCVDSAECSICLEEFEVGVAMARLECLCRFHKRCIGAWWERHPGRCPMHQHDGLGY